MTHRLYIQSLAETDIANAALWYESQRTGLAAEFLDEIHAALEKLVANPRQYRRLRRVPEVRRVLIERFPYGLFYVLRPESVVLFRVLHHARNKREWKGSIPVN